MSISTEIDLLITNMIIFSRLEASFPVKVAKKVNIEKKTVKWLNILTSPWAILFFFFMLRMLARQRDVNCSWGAFRRLTLRLRAAYGGPQTPRIPVPIPASRIPVSRMLPLRIYSIEGLP